MMNELAELVTGEMVVQWLIIAFLVGYFVYKEWPEFKKRITSGALRQQQNEETDRTMGQRLDGIEKEIRLINEKLDRDYEWINKTSIWKKRHQKLAEDSLEERELIMNGVLGCLKGLQQLGANGSTAEAEADINAYLNKRAHDNDVDDIEENSLV